jgi:hypothetical protein
VYPWLEMLATQGALQLRIGNVDFVCEVMSNNKITCAKLDSGSQNKHLKIPIEKSGFFVKKKFKI